MTGLIELDHSDSDLKVRRIDLRHTHAVILEKDKKLLTSHNRIELLQIVQKRIENSRIVELTLLHGKKR